MSSNITSLPGHFIAEFLKLTGPIVLCTCRGNITMLV